MKKDSSSSDEDLLDTDDDEAERASARRRASPRTKRRVNYCDDDPEEEVPSRRLAVLPGVTRIRKYFEKSSVAPAGWYEGTVTQEEPPDGLGSNADEISSASTDAENNNSPSFLYWIHYDDGDREQMTVRDIRCHAKAYRDFHQSNENVPVNAAKRAPTPSPVKKNSPKRRKLTTATRQATITSFWNKNSLQQPPSDKKKVIERSAKVQCPPKKNPRSEDQISSESESEVTAVPKNANIVKIKSYTAGSHLGKRLFSLATTNVTVPCVLALTFSVSCASRTYY
jgi:hypothetical protein